jgi:hypothetical protein
MKKLLVSASLIALLSIVNIHAASVSATGSQRTTVRNDSDRDVWMAWTQVKTKTKREYYHLAPKGGGRGIFKSSANQFTTTHITSVGNKVTIRYYQCKNGNPVQQELEYKKKMMNAVIVITNDPKNPDTLIASEEVQK